MTEREQLIEKMAEAGWEKGTGKEWKDASKKGIEQALIGMTAALDVAAPVLLREPTPCESEGIRLDAGRLLQDSCKNMLSRRLAQYTAAPDPAIEAVKKIKV